MTAMIVLFMLTASSDGDAIVVLLLGTPVIIMWGMIIWGATSED